MLTVVTGVPGAGKTSLAVERYLMPLAAKGWVEKATTPEGVQVDVKRRLFTNINGLLLEHEKIDAADLDKWPEWVKPGDLIVFDEVQKPWPLTGANKEQPKCITELETHRHYGIDMILLTQHPMLINAAIVRLAGQHLHVRKVGNSRFATVYEWDGVSRTLLYKNSMAKKPWRRGKAVEKMYRSSDLHTKQKRAIPTVLFVILFCLIAFPLLAWKFGGSFKDRYFSGKPLIETAAAKEAGKSLAGPQAAASAPAGGQGAPPVEKPVAKFLGCAATAKRCTCFDSDGTQVDKGPGFCQIQTAGMNGPPQALDRLVVPEQARHEAELAAMQRPDTELIAFARARDEAQRKLPALAGKATPLQSKTP